MSAKQTMYDSHELSILNILNIAEKYKKKKKKKKKKKGRLLQFRFFLFFYYILFSHKKNVVLVFVKFYINYTVFNVSSVDLDQTPRSTLFTVPFMGRYIYIELNVYELFARGMG